MKEAVAKLWRQSPFLTISYIVICLIVILMPLHAFVSTWLGTTIGPLWLFKSWKEIMLAILGAGGLLWLLSSSQGRSMLRHDRFLQLIGLYALITLIVAALHLPDLSKDAVMAGLGMNLRYPLILAIAYVIAKQLPINYGAFRHVVLHGLMWIGAILAIVGILQVFVIDKNVLAHFGYDKATTIAPYVLIDENPNALRAFATMRGPNDYAAFLILPILISLLLGTLQKRRYLLLSIPMVMALFLSGSRSAWIGTLVAVMTLGVIVFGRHVLRNKRVVLAGVAGFLVGLGLVIAAFTIPAVRLAIFHSSPGDASLTEGSTDNHWKATWGGIQRVVANPFGHGVGYAGPASYYGDQPLISENYYVQIAEEVGLIGVLLFIALLVVILRRLYDQRPDTLAVVLFAGFIGISAIAFWLHVWSDDPLSLTYFMLAGIVLGVASRSTEAGKSGQAVVS